MVIWEFIKNIFIEEHYSGHLTYGGSPDVRKTIKIDNIALLISIIAIIIALWK
jgi:hypothetical protein